MEASKFVELDGTYYRLSVIKSVRCEAHSSNDPVEKAILTLELFDSRIMEVRFSDCRSAIHRLWDITQPGWDD
jgi:hypothetical protein